MPQPIWAGDDVELRNLHPESPRISESIHTPYSRDAGFNDISLADRSTDKVVVEAERKCWDVPLFMAPISIAFFLVVGSYITILVPLMIRWPSHVDTVGEGEPAWPEHTNLDESVCLFYATMACLIHYVIFIPFYKWRRDRFCFVWVTLLATCLSSVLLYIWGYRSILTLLGDFDRDFQSMPGTWACRMQQRVGSATFNYGAICGATVSRLVRSELVWESADYLTPQQAAIILFSMGYIFYWLAAAIFACWLVYGWISRRRKIL